MFTSAGFSTPRGPFAGAAPLAHRPLSAIAATAAGGVPQSRIQRLIAELIPTLEELHEDGRICGDISVHSIGLDETGRAHLMALSGYAPAVEPKAPTPGYAPFELYTEDSEWPRGPWTDIYGLCAVAYALVTGQRPPAAPERRISETYRPLATMDLPKYDAAFCQAVDAGLAVAPAARPRTVQALAELLALPAPPRAAEPAVALAPAATPAAAPDAPGRAHRQSFRAVARAILLGVATLGVSAYWWGRLTGAPEGVITHSETVVGADPTPVERVAPPSLRDPAPVAMAELPAAEWQGGYAEAAPGVSADAPAPAEPADGNAAPASAAPSQTPPPPARVRVSINVRPWGEILINGVPRGVTPPLKTLRLAPGKYSVTIRNSAQPPYRTTLEVKAGQPTMISHIFR